MTSFLAMCSVTSLLTGAAAGQSLTATLTGTVTAPDGARLPGVTLLLRHVDSADVVESVSSDAGVFRITDLGPGRYQLDAALAGFEPRTLDITLDFGQTSNVSLWLEVATLREQVQVVAATPRDTVEAFGIRESSARDVGEALASVPGVTKLRKGAIANDVVVRGFQGKDVTVLIDGQRLDGACPGHMDPPAFHVDFAEVNRVEVSKGPFDVKNQGGLAGLVNIVTERPQRGLHGSANVVVGSAATFAPSASASGGGNSWAVLGGASSRRADPYEDGAGIALTDRANYVSGAADLEAYDAWTAWGRLALMPLDGASLQLSYTRQSAGTILYPYLQMDALFDDADRAGIRFEMSELPGGWRSLAAHVYFTQVDHWMTDEFRTSGVNMPRAYSMGTRAKTQIVGGKAEIQRAQFTFGAEASRRAWDTTTMLAGMKYVPQYPLADVTIETGGAFAAYSAAAGSAWRFDAGARLDRATTAADPSRANTALYLAYHGTTSTSASDWLPAGYARATWSHTSGWKATGGIGRAHRLPDQQERFYALKRMGSDWVGNPNLSPSANTGVDGEFRYTGRGIDVGVAAFVYRVDDGILVVDQARVVKVPGVMNTMARSYANVDTLVRGVEGSATLPVASSLFLSLNGSYQRGTTRGQTTIDGDLSEMPPARARVLLRYDNARWNAAAEFVGALAQAHVAEQLRESTTPAYAVLNVRAGFRSRRFGVTAAVDNVFDALYAEHLSYQRDPFRNGTRVYEPGRTLSVNLSAGF